MIVDTNYGPLGATDLAELCGITVAEAEQYIAEHGKEVTK